MRTRFYIAVLGFTLGFAVQCHAADANVVGAGYQFPPIAAAPGQVLTMFVQGITVPQRVFAAGAGQWSTTLDGFSAQLAAATTTGIRTLSIPIGTVFPFLNCGTTATGSPCGALTGLTIQIPFEILGAVPSTALPPPLPAAVLTVIDEQGHSAVVTLNPLADQIHVLKSLDTIVGGNGGGGDPAVTHADGRTVSASSPAKAGEILVMYAVGLGSTTPSIGTGAPSPASPLATAQEQLRLHYDFQANAAPSPSVQGPSTGDTTTLFVGLAPKFVGLYQVNFLVPIPPSDAIPCGGTVASNLTVTLVGYASYDGAGICVEANGH
jgi:uncharacterized protein (TIGR03437 family)